MTRHLKLLVEMNDGTRLNTSVFLPDGKGPWPVIFSRTPYPHMMEWWSKQAAKWTEQGYVYVVQQCRGTGESEGEWIPFIHERQDGLTSIKWLLQQDWMDGQIALAGSSYSGVVQWCMIDDLPKEVKTAFIGFTGIERFRQSYMNGMFRHDVYTYWAVQNSGEEIDRNLYKEALSVRPHILMDQHLFNKELSWYRDWIKSVDKKDPYWQGGFWSQIRMQPAKTKIPILMTAGWFDHNLDASIQSFGKLSKDIREKSCLVIGPWVHHEGVSGDLTFPNHEQFGENQFLLALEWMNCHLKGGSSSKPGKIYTYQIRNDQWNEDKELLPFSKKKQWFLEATLSNSRTLNEVCTHASGKISYTYDPHHPVDTKGGAALLHYLSNDPFAAPPAAVKQRKSAEREDIIPFLTSPFEEAILISGSLEVQLFVSSTAEDTSFSVNIIEVFENGDSYNIRDGIATIQYRKNDGIAYDYTPCKIVEIQIETWPITWLIKKGSRLRLDISSSNFPAYHIHPNVKGTWSEQKEYKLAQQTIYTGGSYKSNISTPIR